MGIESYEHANTSKGLEDYVLLVLEPPLSHHEAELSYTREALADVQRLSGEVDHDRINATLQTMPEFKYMLYFVPCLLSKESCIEALRHTDRDIDDLLEYIEQEMRTRLSMTCITHSSTHRQDRFESISRSDIQRSSKLNLSKTRAGILLKSSDTVP